MIVIVDSGSTKADWAFLDKKNNLIASVQTMGLNPNFLSEADILKYIQKQTVIKKYAKEVKRLYFYGASCSLSIYKEKIQRSLNLIFQDARIYVQSDLLGAAYASYAGQPAIVCILGTGSNAAYFDGKTLFEQTPSLGFILGDEGSGNHLGKLILQAYFLKKMPNELTESFDQIYSLTLGELSQKVYCNPFANVYLAGFASFMVKHKSHIFIKKLLYESFDAFFTKQVQPLAYKGVSLCFVGSVAYVFADVLTLVSQQHYFKIQNIVKRPIGALVEYHLKHI